MRNLITAQEVIDLAFAENSNMREESISATSIHIAEIKYIRPAFGDMYALLADKYAAYTNDYVKPALAYFVKCEILSSIAIDMSNSGVAVANPQYMSAASDKQRQRLYDSEMSKAKTLLDFALSYISAHKDDFPDFAGTAPKRHHRVGGLLIPMPQPSASQGIQGEAFKAEYQRYLANMEAIEKEAEEAAHRASEVSKQAEQILPEAKSATDAAEKATDAAKSATADAAAATTATKKALTEFNAQRNNYAQKQGYYPNMSVGMADNLVGRGEAQDAMFSLRPSGGKSINDGTARITSVKGNSVVYNQLYRQDKSTPLTNRGVVYSSNLGVISIVGTLTETNYITFCPIELSTPAIIGHKYLVELDKDMPDGYYIGFGGEANLVHRAKRSDIFTATRENSKGLYILGEAKEQTVGTEYNYSSRAVIRDLTKMFGAGNEPTTVEEFYARKPIGIDEYAYNEGVILDNRVSEIKSTSNNAYDPTLGYARVIGGKTYNFDGTFGEVQFSATIDGAREAIEVADGGQYTMPNDGYVWLSGSDICVCLAHSYEKPYSEHEVDIVNLAMVQEAFPEGMRSAGTACDEIRYNKTTKKWEKVPRIGVVDLGSLTWTTDAVGDKIGFVCRKAVVTPPKSIYTKPNMLCAPFETTTQAGNNQYANDNVIFSNISGWLFVAAWEYNGDAAAFKTEMDGVMLYYELAEPDVEPIEGSENWNLDYRAWDFGTEEAIASVPSAPFRANIVYEFNAVDDIRWAYAEIKKLQARVTQLESAQASENPITE